jgi:hypothetical protein
MIAYSALRNLDSNSYAAHVFRNSVATVPVSAVAQARNFATNAARYFETGLSEKYLLQLHPVHKERSDSDRNKRPRDLRTLPAVGAIIKLGIGNQSSQSFTLACVLEVNPAARRPLVVQLIENNGIEVMFVH